MPNYECNICEMDNLPVGHWMSYIHLQNEITKSPRIFAPVESNSDES